MQRALELCEASGNRFAVRASIITLGDIYHRQGELRRAAELLHQALAEAVEDNDIPDNGRVLTGLAAISYEWNELEKAQQRVQEALELGEHLADEAIPLLEDRLTEAREAGRLRSALEIQLIMALAYASLKQPQPARTLLREVLVLAHSEGYRRLFLDEGKPVADLLRVLLPEVQEKPLIAYIHTLLRAFAPAAAPAPASLSASLSPQEARVLRLLVAGQSRQEMARELVVSINTIKTHLQRIYQKLNVTSRREAREVVRSLDLL